MVYSFYLEVLSAVYLKMYVDPLNAIVLKTVLQTHLLSNKARLLTPAADSLAAPGSLGTHSSLAPITVYLCFMVRCVF